MRGSRAKQLKTQARVSARDGSVVTSTEYKRLKKIHVHPSYAPHTSHDGTSPGVMFKGKSVLARKKKGLKAGIQNHV